MGSDGDAELMLRLQGGEDTALNELMNRWQQPLVNFIYRIRDSRDPLTTPAGRRSAAGIAIPILLLYLGEGAKKHLKSPGAPTAAQHP
jgi:hypothetical protein